MSTPDLTALRKTAEAEFLEVPRGHLLALLDRVEAAELWTVAHPCVLAAAEPYDFMWCETHDRTFPLDGDCDHKGKSAIDWLTDREQEQRIRAIRAEARAEAAEAAVARVRELAHPDWCLSVPVPVKQAIIARLDGGA